MGQYSKEELKQALFRARDEDNQEMVKKLVPLVADAYGYKPMEEKTQEPRRDAVDMFHSKVQERRTEKLDKEYEQFGKDTKTLGKATYNMAADMVPLPSRLKKSVLPQMEYTGEEEARAAKVLQQSAASVGISQTSLLGGIASAKGTGKLVRKLPLPGWVKSAAIVTGGVVGMGGTEFALTRHIRDYAREKGLVYESVESLPHDVQRYAHMGENIFGAAISSGVLAGLAKFNLQSTGGSWVGNKFNEMMHFAKQSPVAFTFAETIAGVAASNAGEYTAKKFDNDPTARFLAEITAGSLIPTDAIARKLQKGWANLRSRWLSMKKHGANVQAGDFVRTLMQNEEIDVSAAAKIWDEFGDEDLNIAATLGSQNLGELMLQLEKHDKQLAKNNKLQVRDVLKTFSGIISQLRKSSDPQEVVEAARLQRIALEEMLAASIVDAETQLFDTAKNLLKNGDTKEIRDQLSLENMNKFESLLKTMRAVESDLHSQYGDINLTLDDAGEFIASLQDLYKQFDRIDIDHAITGKSKEYLKDIFDSLGLKGKDAKNQFNPVRKKKKYKKKIPPLTAQKIQRFRSSLLEEIAVLYKDRKYQQARMLGEIEGGLLRVLNNTYSDDEAFETARNFSRQLNEHFTRSFIGKSLAVGDYGRVKPPELIMVDVMSGGPEKVRTYMRQIEDSAMLVSRSFEELSSKVGPEAAEMLSSSRHVIDDIRNVHERLLRLKAAGYTVVDEAAETATINSKGLRSFIDENRSFLDRYGLVEEFESVLTSNRAKIDALARAKNTTRDFERKRVYGKLINSENPVLVVKEAIVSEIPEKKLDALIQVVESAGENSDIAKDALRSSIISALIDLSASPDGDVINFEKMRKLLLDDAFGSKKSLMSYLVSKKLFSNLDVKNFEFVFDRTEKILKSRVTDVVIDETTLREQGSFWFDQFITGFGATQFPKVAKMIDPNAGGHDLLLAHRGAALGRYLAEKMPSVNHKAALADILTNRDLFKKYVVDPVQKETVDYTAYKKAHAYLMGGNYFYEEEDREPPVFYEGELD